MKLGLGIALALVAATLSAASSARADQTTASITWTPGRIEPAREEATDGAREAPNAEGEPAPFDTYVDVMVPDRELAPHSPGLAGFVGIVGGGSCGVVGALAAPRDPTLGGFFIGLSLSGAGLAAGSLLAPTRGALLDDLERARRLLPNHRAAAAEFERAFARAAARERKVRKITSVVVIGGALGSLGAAIANGIVHDSARASTTLISASALVGAIGINDFIRPWEIETRYATARAKAFDLRVGAAPLPGGGAALQLGGVF